MKILPVNSADNHYSNPKTQSFNGLWGKTSRQVRTVRDFVHRRKEMHYHPFLDEKASDLRHIIEKHESIKEGISECSVEKVLVDMRLPITKGEWVKYTTDRASMNEKDAAFIEQYVKRNGLTIHP